MRTFRIGLVVTEAERDIWFSAAKQRDVSVSALIRRCMNAVATGKIDVPDVPKPTNEEDKS